MEQIGDLTLVPLAVLAAEVGMILLVVFFRTLLWVFKEFDYYTWWEYVIEEGEDTLLFIGLFITVTVFFCLVFFFLDLVITY